MSKTKFRIPFVLGALALVTGGIVACGGSSDSGSSSNLSGNIRIDGSSTLAPLTEAIAEGFQSENPDVKVTVGTSGTGGGFEKFCAGETDANDASSQIDSEQKKLCKEGGVKWEELQVANDAVSVVVNPENPVKCLTVDQLSSIWEDGSDLTNWNEIKGVSPTYDAELTLFGPGTDSGTFEYFTEAVNGEEGNQRKNYNNVGEDDNQTVTGVSGAPGGMGYFGYSFLVENEGTVRGLEIDNGDGCVAPSEKTVQDGSYSPLARPLFVYPSAKALNDKAFDQFMRFYLDNVNDVASSVGFIGLTESQLSEGKKKLEKLISG